VFDKRRKARLVPALLARVTELAASLVEMFQNDSEFDADCTDEPKTDEPANTSRALCVTVQ
jgi:hypothetical protein